MSYASGSGGGSLSASDDEEKLRLRHSDVGRRRGRRRLTNWNGLRTPRPNSPAPPPRRHGGDAGSSRAAAPAPPPPLPASSAESSDDESYSSIDSVSTDDGDELIKIVDPDELEARVLAKSVRSQRRAEKRRRVDAEYEEVMNEVRLEQGLRQDAEHTARAREWEEVRRRQRLNRAFAFSDSE